MYFNIVFIFKGISGNVNIRGRIRGRGRDIEVKRIFYYVEFWFVRVEVFLEVIFIFVIEGEIEVVVVCLRVV